MIDQVQELYTKLEQLSGVDKAFLIGGSAVLAGYTGKWILKKTYHLVRHVKNVVVKWRRRRLGMDVPPSDVAKAIMLLLEDVRGWEVKSDTEFMYKNGVRFFFAKSGVQISVDNVDIHDCLGKYNEYIPIVTRATAVRKIVLDKYISEKLVVAAQKLKQIV